MIIIMMKTMMIADIIQVSLITNMQEWYTKLIAE